MLVGLATADRSERGTITWSITWIAAERFGAR
jgi:hypothetical protein